MRCRFQFSLEDLFLFTAFVATMICAAPMLLEMLGGFVGLFQEAR